MGSQVNPDDKSSLEEVSFRYAHSLQQLLTDANVERTEIDRESAEALIEKAEIIEAGTRIVEYIITFRAKVKNTTSDEAFKAMIMKEVTLSGRAEKSLVSAVVVSIKP